MHDRTSHVLRLRSLPSRREPMIHHTVPARFKERDLQLEDVLRLLDDGDGADVASEEDEGGEEAKRPWGKTKYPKMSRPWLAACLHALGIQPPKKDEDMAWQ